MKAKKSEDLLNTDDIPVLLFSRRGELQQAGAFCANDGETIDS